MAAIFKNGRHRPRLALCIMTLVQ